MNKGSGDVPAFVWSREGRIRYWSRIRKNHLLNRAAIFFSKVRIGVKVETILRTEVHGKTEVLEMSDSDE